MFKIGCLLCVKDLSFDRDQVFCWHEDIAKKDVNAFYIKHGTIGIFTGLWHTKTNGLDWYKVLIGKREYLFTLGQLELYVEPTHPH